MNCNNILTAVLLVTASFTSVFAQKKDTTGLKRELILEKEYNPMVRDASKINTLPAVDEPVVTKKDIRYSDWTIALIPKLAIHPLSSGNIDTDRLFDNKNGYFNFGIGNYLNMNANAGYRILDNKKDQLSVMIGHNSTNGNVKYLQINDEVKQKLSETNAAIAYKHVFEPLTLNLSTSYANNSFNYYGWNLISDTTLNTGKSQNNRLFALNTLIKSNEGSDFEYEAGFNYYRFAQKYGVTPLIDGPKESHYQTILKIAKPFRDIYTIGIEGEMHNLTYSLDTTGGFFEHRSFKNYTAFLLNPYLGIKGDNYNLRVGAIVDIVFRGDVSYKMMPDLKFDWQFADHFQFYANTLDGLHINSLYAVSKENRYLNPAIRPKDSETFLDATIGLRSNVVAGFWFDIYTGYRYTEEELFFTQFNPNIARTTDFYHNVANPVELDASCFKLGTTLKYNHGKLLDLSLNIQKNFWSVKGGDLRKPWNKPDMEVVFDGTVKPIDKLSLNLYYHLSAGRNACNFINNKSVKMKNINELNIRGQYELNDWFAVSLSMNNILVQKYDIWYGMPAQGFNAIAGVGFRF